MQRLTGPTDALPIARRRQSIETVLRQHLVAPLVAERERWPLWLPVFFGLGIAGYFAVPFEPTLWLGPVASLVVLAVLIFFRRALAWRLGLLVIFLVAMGFAVAQLRSALVEAPRLSGSWGAGELQAEVLSVEERARGWRLLLRPLKMEGRAASDLPRKLRITAYRIAGTPNPGQIVILRARLRPPSAPTMPGAFDFARQAYFQQLGGIGFALGTLRVMDPDETDLSVGGHGLVETWRLFWSQARQRIAERISAVLPNESGAVAVALVTGQRGAITDETREDMRGAGLAHLLAISGLHMGLVAGLLFFTLRAGLASIPALALRFPIKKWAALAAGLGAFLYLCLVGGTIPAQRAFLMIAIVLMAVLLERRALSLRLVAWAAMVVLLVAPESLVSASFQMSFAAVVALVSLYETWDRGRGLLDGERRAARQLGGYFLGVAATSLVAILATSAFAAYHFQRLALFGLLANLVAVPLTAFVIMPAAVLGIALMPFGLEALGFVPMGWGIDLLLWLAAEVANLPAASLAVPPMPLWGLASVALGGLWLCLWQGLWRRWGLILILLGAFSPLTTVPPDLLVSGDGRLVAFRDSERRLWLADRRASGFVIDSWRRGSFAHSVESWPATGEAAEGRLSCDPLGCLLRKAGLLAAVARDPSAVADDCAKADLVVSLEPLRRQPCSGPSLVLDRFDLWRHGGHAVWLEPSGPRALAVSATQGQRPWSPFIGRWTKRPQ